MSEHIFHGQNKKTFFLNKVKFNQDTFCWEWLGSKLSSGYGCFSFNRKTEIAHRTSYILFNGEIQKGLEINHVCRNRACVNPEHLEAVTHSQNMKHIARCEKHPSNNNFCKNGHELITGNLDNWALKKGLRQCLKCKKERNVLRKRIGTVNDYRYLLNTSKSKIDPIQFALSISNKFGESSAKRAVKNILILNGFEPDGRTIISAQRFLKKVLDNDEVNLNDLASAFGIFLGLRRIRTPK